MTVTKKLLCDVFSDLFLREEDLDIEAITPEFSTRHYYRIFLKSNKVKQTFVLQVADTFDSFLSNPFLTAQNIYEKHDLPVPKIYGFDGEKGWVLIEDLGACFLQEKPTERFYKKGIEILVDINTRIKPTSSSEKSFTEAPQWKWFFDVEKYQFEMGFCETHFIQNFMSESFSILNLTEHNSSFLAERANFFCHRDYHCRNLLVKEEEVFVIDFQDSRWGPLSYDMVSYLWDPYSNLESSIQEKYFLYWRECVSEKISDFVWEDGFEEEFYRMKIQRLIKVIGSYASLFHLKQRTTYLPYIIPAYNFLLKAFDELEKRGFLTDSDEKLQKIFLSLYDKTNVKVVSHG